MIEIKNKISNSKERKKQDRFNKYMILQRKVRFKFIKYFPLTQKEKIMYKEIKSFRKEPLRPDTGKYYVLNRKVHLLSVISKDELENFCLGIESLFKSNPAKSAYRRTILNNDLRERILDYQGSSNRQGCSCIGYITPKDENLKNIVTGIDILMFGFSSDYVGVAFELDFTDEFNNYVNERLIGDINKEERYSFYHVGDKKFITRNHKVEEILRKEEIDDILIEIKMRSYNFLSKYINLLPISTKAPISLDEFSTNYDYDEEKNQFLLYYDIYNYKANGSIEVIYEKMMENMSKNLKENCFVIIV